VLHLQAITLIPKEVYKAPLGNKPPTILVPRGCTGKDRKSSLVMEQARLSQNSRTMSLGVRKAATLLLELNELVKGENFL
jgi:hypothetical protein